MQTTHYCVSWFTTLCLCAATANADEDIHAHEHEHETHPETEHIVITATPLEHSSDELASPVNTMQRDDIIESLGTTVGETISGIPGITTSGFARGSSRPIIRGQDAYRTEVLEDGLPTQDVSRLSPDHGIPVNPLSARTIEVVRGPATLRYGGGAVGGVVNTITNRVPREATSETESEIYSSFETNGNEGILAARIDTGASHKEGDLAFHFDGLYRNSDNYRTGGGRAGDRSQAGTQSEVAAGSLGASWITERGRIGAAYSHFRNNYGIPEAGEDVTVEMATHRVRLDGDLFDPLPGFTELRLRAGYTDYRHDEIADGAIGQRFDNDEFEARLELLHEEVAGFSGALGLDTRYRKFVAGGEAAEFLAPTRTQSTAVYLFEERALAEWLHAELGGRVEKTSLRGAPDPVGTSRRTLDFTPLSGSLGFVVHATEEWTIGLRGAVSQRAPGQAELFARGPHEATGTYEIGDPNLDEETAYTGELRVGHIGERVRLDLASFVSRYEDYIYGRLTGVAVLPDLLDELRYESHDALFYGGEMSAELDLFEREGFQVAVDAQFDWVEARFTRPVSGDRDVPRITPIRWGGGLSIEKSQTRAHLSFLRTEQQNRVAAGESDTDGFTMLDLSMSQTVVLADGLEVDVLLRASNLLDVSARNHVAFNKDEVRQPGRSFRIGVQGRF